MGKIIKRVLAVIGVLLLLLVAAAIVLPIIYKDKIVSYVKAEANKRVNAKLDFDNDISLSLFKNFPDFTIGIDSIKIINNAPFEDDTLVYIENFEATLDIMSVIKGSQIFVKRIALNKPFINLQVLKDGKANWDVALADDEELQKEGEDTSSAFNLKLNHYEITKGTLIYNDSSLTFYTRLDTFNHSGSGNFSDVVYDLKTKTDIQRLTVGYDGINYLSNVEADADAVLNIDTKNMKFTFKDNVVHLNALELAFNGYLAMPDDNIVMDMTYSAKKTEFKNILSLLPAIYKKDFNNIKTSGKFALEGDVKGTYNDNTFPGFKVLMNIENGMFQYPDLPSAVKDININANISSAGGSNLDNTVINISKAHLNMAGAPIDGHIVIQTPISDPYIDGAVKGKVQLSDVEKFMKLDAGTVLKGLIDADVRMKGNMSSIENGQYEKFNAAGYIAGSNVHYASADLARPIDISTTRLDFSPQYLKLAPTTVQLGNSDITAKGEITSYMSYLFKDGVLKGSLDLASNYFDINPWISSSDADPNVADSSQGMEVIDLPGNIDFVLNSNFKSLSYEKFDIKNFVGQVHLHDKKLDFNNVGLSMLGGVFGLDGYYNTQNPKVPETNMNFAIKSIEIPALFSSFVTVQRFAPIAKYMSGNMDAKLSVDTRLNQNMMPDWNTLSSNGVLIIDRAVLAGFEPLNKVADALNLPKLKDVVLTGIRPSYQISQGRFILKDPVKFNVGQTNFSVLGSNGLDKTLDYAMEVNIPSSELQNKANSAIEQIFKNRNLESPVGKMVKLNVSIKGTIDNPIIKVDLKDFAQKTLENIKDQAKEAIKEEVTKKVEEVKKDLKAKADEIMKKAQASADAARATAQRLADEAKKQGYAAAQKLEDEANNPLSKKAAQIAANKMRSETDQKVNQILNEGNKKATEILQRAQDEINKLE